MTDNALPGWYPDPHVQGMDRWWDGEEWLRIPQGQRPSRGHDRYKTFVNKGSLNMASFGRMLNAEWRAGWALHTVIEQHGNTMVVFQRY